MDTDIDRKDTPKRILIVEDEFLIALTAMSDLHAEGFEVVVKSDGRQGLLAANSEHFDLIITDYIMPNMNGIDMIHAIRHSGERTPIVLTSSMNPSSLPQTACGFNTFLPKPYRATDLCALAHRFTSDMIDHKLPSAHRPSVTKAGPIAAYAN